MRYNFTLLSLLLLTSVLVAQSSKNEKEFIKEMCGCYEVKFQYAETFASSEEYTRHNDYSAKGLEWIFVDEETETELVLQHLLIVSPTRVIKHWRQDWQYQNTEFLNYEKNLEWKRQSLDASEVSGTWTQKVYEVDDSPRYQGYATWVNLDGKKYWESQVTAPLPRREYTKRSDYNLMLRNNKHRITDYGHVHELDNAKIIRSESGDSTLVWEKGMNVYTKVSDKRCKLAKDYWKDQRDFWVDVRAEWSSLLSEKEYVNVKWEIEGDRLYHRIFALQNKLNKDGKYTPGSGSDQIRKIIEDYLSSEPSPWVSNTTKSKDNY